MLEKIIRDALVKHVSSNDLHVFSDVQHGFISGKSCVTQLLEYKEDLTKAVDSGCDVDVIYFDFCKAFDKVPHKRVGLITPGHPRIPQDTPGHPRIHQDAFNFLYNSFIYSFIYSFRQKQSKNGI